uniref:Dynamin-type G domain-containing protein n=1 Tax=Trichuris muris TaxID=70415 RepID=A0A5S6QRX2_TRIMR
MTLGPIAYALSPLLLLLLLIHCTQQGGSTRLHENNLHRSTRDRSHIERILLGPEDALTDDADPATRTTLEQLRKIFRDKIKPMQDEFHYQDLSRNIITESDINAEPVVLVVGPWSTGKSTLIKYLLGIEHKTQRIKTGTEPSTSDFHVLTYGKRHRTMDGAMLVADQSKPFGWMQQFGSAFLEHLKAIELPNELLRRVTIIDTPGLAESRRPNDRRYPFDDVMSRLIQRSDLILIVFDPTKLDAGKELESMFTKLKQKESALKFILNKADTVSTEDLVRVYGALMWSLSTLYNVTEHPRVYMGSFWSKSIANEDLGQLFYDEESQVLEDIRELIENKVRYKIASLRQYAIQVKAHALIVDSFVCAYRRQKRLFFDDEQLAEMIVRTPEESGVYKRALSNPDVNAYDLPSHSQYAKFFSLNKLQKQKRLKDLCYLLIGCPQLDKLNGAINVDLPRLFTRTQKRMAKEQRENKLFVYDPQTPLDQPKDEAKTKVKLERRKGRLPKDQTRREARMSKSHRSKVTPTAEEPRVKEEIGQKATTEYQPRELKQEEASEEVTVESEEQPTEQHETFTLEIPDEPKITKLPPEVKRELPRDTAMESAAPTKCPKYRKTCQPAEKKAQVHLVQEAAVPPTPKCPKYRKTCESRKAEALQPAQEKIIAVHVLEQKVKCAKYRKSCNATTQVQVEQTPKGVPVVHVQLEPPKCPKFRKSCVHGQPMVSKGPSHPPPQKHHRQHQPQHVKAKKRLTKRRLRTIENVKRHTPKKEVEAALKAQATLGCNKYRKSCQAGMPPSASVPGKAPSTVAQTASEKPKCPLYRKSCNATQPQVRLAEGDATKPKTNGTHPAQPSRCNKYRISCKKLQAEIGLAS